MEKEPDIAYWQPRVMRHGLAPETTEYAVHEVYFNDEHRAVTWTKDAVSPHMPSPAVLKKWISDQLAAPDDGVVCGDRGYTHHHGDFELWLKHVNEPPLEYGPTGGNVQ
jgi:hypothetical protein